MTDLIPEEMLKSPFEKFSRRAEVNLEENAQETMSGSRLMWEQHLERKRLKTRKAEKEKEKVFSDHI